ncbi:D-cysteine desulfhydrase family protein [SAR92 clade bacterium H921]|jgi:D-cysteine desulfhydrase|nr:D-cysteine desulfhydrase family protein [SAR92 clade bacterium H921]
MVSLPENLSLAQTPTPLHSLDRLTAQLNGPRIWIKRDDLTGCLTSGNKVRKLEFLLADAIANGCDTLITSGGVQSNHCRAVAVLGAQLGLNVHLLLRSDIEPAPVGNLLLDQLVGATISHYSKQEFNQLDAIFSHWQEHYREQGAKPYCIPTGGSNGMGVWGYIAAAEELKADFARENISPSRLVLATGSGGTQAGLIVGCALHNIPISIEAFAVCDNAAYFERKVRDDLRQWQQQFAPHIDVEEFPINTNDQYVGPDYGAAGPEVFATLKELAALEGVILDPVYTGKAFHGMLQQIRQGHYRDDTDIVFVHTGGLFGLLAQQDQLNY